MEIYLLIGMGIIAGLLLVLIILQQQKPNHQEIEETRKNLSEQIYNQQRTNNENMQILQTNMHSSLKELDEQLDKLTLNNAAQLAKFQDSFSTALVHLNQNNSLQADLQTRRITEAVGKLQDSNEKRLDQMRQTVDEKLSTTLNKSLSDSFKNVSDQLNSLYNSLGEMKQLSNAVTSNVSSLNRVLTNVKARGTWAEVQLANILDQTIPGMYVENYSPNNDGNRVEFAVKIPNGTSSDKYVYLPIDSKLPLEDYIRLTQAIDSNDLPGINQARKELENRVMSEAKMITKYIAIPTTTPYAIMYLATEGLYAEVASNKDGLAEKIQSTYKVMIAGPTTITALLNSLALGFKAVAINEKADEVRLLLEASKSQYAKLEELLIKAKQKIDEAGQTIDKASDRNRIIEKKLHNVSTISNQESEQRLGYREDGENKEVFEDK